MCIFHRWRYGKTRKDLASRLTEIGKIYALEVVQEKTCEKCGKISYETVARHQITQELAEKLGQETEAV